MIAEILKQFYHKILIHGRNAEPYYKLFGWIGLIAYPGYYVVTMFILPNSYDNVTIRIIAALLCLSLILKDKWPKKAQGLLPICWFVTLLFCLAFFSNFMALKNSFLPSWQLTIMACLFILILITNWISMLCIYALGLILALAAYFLTGGTAAVLQAYFTVSSVYLFLGIASSLFVHKIQHHQSLRLDAMATLSGNIAHELRTPLLGLRGAIEGYKKYIPILYDGYKQAREAGLNVTPIRRNQLQNLLPALDRMNSEIDFSNAIIDMLQMNAGNNKVNEAAFAHYNILPIIETALDRYPFDSAEFEAKIHLVKDDDFIFLGSDLLLENMIFNLMKNALHFIVQAQKGEITIWLEQHPKFNSLHFKDSGEGIPSERLPLIFERFYSSTLTGTGIGLAFCKAVMKSFKGSISCRSIPGKFTEFILKFPKVNEA